MGGGGEGGGNTAVSHTSIPHIYYLEIMQPRSQGEKHSYLTACFSTIDVFSHAYMSLIGEVFLVTEFLSFEMIL